MAKRKAKKPAKRKPIKRKPLARKISKLPKEAVTLIVILRSKEGQHLLLEAEIRALLGPSRKEEGCLQYDLHHSLDNPSLFLLHEVWATRAAHTAHSKTPHFLRWDARKDSLLASVDRTFWQQIV
ncbi:MAG TPA: putative quinol monooxygenase [Candidatus Acidoferrum sp.]|jgi:quinol monooxygenase YgiN